MSILKELIFLSVLLLNLYFIKLLLLGEFVIDYAEWLVIANGIGLWACDAQNTILELFK